MIAVRNVLRRLFGARPAATHEGATAEWSPAAEVAEADATHVDQPAPDFDTDRWDTDVHAELNALMDAFHHDVDHIWGRFYEWLGVDAAERLELFKTVEMGVAR